VKLTSSSNNTTYVRIRILVGMIGVKAVDNSSEINSLMCVEDDSDQPVQNFGGSIPEACPRCM
jgi:hypothetical protein